jgi:hypothetical protein
MAPVSKFLGTGKIVASRHLRPLGSGNKPTFRKYRNKTINTTIKIITQIIFSAFWTPPREICLGSTQILIIFTRGTIFLAVKRQERDADHSRPSSAEVKKAWLYTYTPP